MQEKREKITQRRIDDEIAKARACAAKVPRDEAGARSHLQRKKLLEAEVTKMRATRANLERMKLQMESSAADQDVVEAFRDTAATMELIASPDAADKVQDIMDGLDEQMAQANEISTAISRPLGGGLADMDVEAELAGLQQEELDKQLLGVGAPAGAPKLPAVPTTPLPKPKVAAAAAEEDELAAELAKLDAQLA